MKRFIYSFVVTMSIVFLFWEKTYSSSKINEAQSIIAYYDGLRRPSPSMVILYEKEIGLVKAFDVMGEVAFSVAWKQNIDDINLQQASSVILSQGTKTKYEKYGILVILAFEDGTSSKYYLNKAKAFLAFEDICNNNGGSAIHNMLEYLDADYSSQP